MQRPRLVSPVLMLTLVLAACAPAAAPSDPAEVRAWFDAPLPETVYWPPNPCQIVGHGASPSGIASFELEINGAAVTLPSPDSQGSLVTLTRDCGLTLPGRYQLRLRAQDNGGNWSGYADTSLIIAAGATDTAPAQPPPAEPTPTPVASATFAAPGAVTIESVETWVVYAGDSSCGPNDVVITARATAPGGIQVVVLFYRYDPGSAGGFQNVAMSPIGGDLYRAALVPNSTFGGPADAILQYQVVVQQTDGDTSVRTPVLADIEVKSCGVPVPAACASYPDKRACEANGCAWVAGPGIVPVYSCQNP